MENLILNMPPIQFKELVRQNVHDILEEDVDFLQTLLKLRPKKASRIKKPTAGKDGFYRTTTPHPVMGQIKILYDPIEPLSEDEWPQEED